jgi:regulatory protein
MVIVDIEEMSKSKVKVSIDNGTSFALYKGELRTYGIAKDGEMPQEVYSKLMDEVLVKRAELRCMNLLKSRDYTRHQLEDKLKTGGYPQEVIYKALSYVISYGYVDDLHYAESYIGYKSSSKSAKQIKNELLRKGVSGEDIEKAFSNCSDGKLMADEMELIERLIEKKKYDKSSATYEERQKITGFLYRKGFSLDMIHRAVE